MKHRATRILAFLGHQGLKTNVVALVAISALGLGTVHTACAVPIGYAFAENEISQLRVQQFIAPAAPITNGTSTTSSVANFVPRSFLFNGGQNTVPINIQGEVAVSNVQQSKAGPDGPDPFPGENDFSREARTNYRDDRIAGRRAYHRG